MGGCTSCGGKERCDDHKHSMFAHIDAALARLYPTRRWGEMDDGAALGAGISPTEGRALAGELAITLRAATTFRTGQPDEYCDYVYVLCQGRQPCLVEVREGGRALPEELAEALSGGAVTELYLRICLSSVARVAAVQEVQVSLSREDGALVLREAPRTGVFSAPLLPRMQRLVAALVEHDVVHLDYGDIYAPPGGYDPGEYGALYGGQPDIANYLFYPQPSHTVSTMLL